MKQMPCIVQDNGSNDRDLVVRSSTCLDVQPLSFEVGIIHLNLFPLHIDINSLTHGHQDHNLWQPGHAKVYRQIAAEFEARDAVFRLPD
jgi:hypothetical protein